MSSSASKGPFADGAEDFSLEPNIPILAPAGSRVSGSKAPKRSAAHTSSRGKHAQHAVGADAPDTAHAARIDDARSDHASFSDGKDASEQKARAESDVHEEAPGEPQGAKPEKKHARPKPSKQKKGVRYIPALDGLRALAVLAVIAYHTGLPACEGGLMGVTVFFVISGYIVTKILLVEFSRTGRIDFKGFYIRRVKRLVPAIVLVIAATGALCTIFNHVLLTKMRPEVLPSLFFVNNWWQILNDASYFENIGLPSPLTHFWSLAIEEQFYLILPITLFCVLKFGGKLRHRRNLSVFILILAALSALEMTLLYDPTQDPTRVYYGTDTRAFSLLMGAFVAVLTTGASDRAPKAIREAFAIIGAIGTIACLALMSGEDPFTYQGGMVICSAFTAFLIFGTLWKDSGIVAKILSLKPLIWIGKRSYGLYLWHYPLVLLFTPVNGTFGLDALYMGAAVVCTFACAELSYRFVENPIRYGIAKSKRAEAAHVDASPANGSHAFVLVPSSTEQLPIVKGLFDAPSAERDSAPKALGHSSSNKMLAQIQRVLPLKLPVALITAVLIVTCGVGLAFVPDTSALSDDGAAIIIRNSMAGEPLSGEVKLATGDEEVPIISLEGEEEDDGEEKPVYDVLMIGDSVALRAVPYFEERFPLGHIDAEKNRRIDQGIDVYQSYEDDGQVGDIVIFALGTNGSLTEAELREAIEAIGPDRQIYFVTIRSTDANTMEQSNHALNVVREEYDNVHLIDWNSLSEMHGDYFDGDGTHLTANAAKIYVQFIADVLQYPSAEEVLAAQAAAEDAEDAEGGEGEGAQGGGSSQDGDAGSSS